MEAIDPQAFRVNLFCACQQDVAYGYGSSLMEARRAAETVFREQHGASARYRQIIVEEATPHEGGSHYELFSAGLRYEFTRGIGAELFRLEVLGDALDTRDHSTHPYLFETNNPTRAAQVCDALRGIVNDARRNQRMRDAAARALDEIKKIARVVW